jgi:chromosome segregation ATPase
MTTEDKKLALFETRIRELIIRFNDLKKDNSSLRAQLDTKNAELQKSMEELELAHREYNSLKMAKMIEIGDGDIEDAKQRLSKLIRDVNKCITLLKGEGV